MGPVGHNHDVKVGFDVLRATAIEQLTGTLTNRWDDTPALTQQTPVNYGTPQPRTPPPATTPPATTPAAPPVASSPPLEPDSRVLAGPELRRLMIVLITRIYALDEIERVIAQIDNTTLDHRRAVHAAQTALTAHTRQRQTLTNQIERHHSTPRRRRTLTRTQAQALEQQLDTLDAELPALADRHQKALKAFKEWDRSLANKPLRHDYTQRQTAANEQVTQAKTPLRTDAAIRAQHLLEGRSHPNLGTPAIPPPGINPQTWATATATIDRHNTAWPQPPAPDDPQEHHDAHQLSRLRARTQHNILRDLNRPERPPPGLTL